MSRFLPRVWLNRFYVGLLVLNCWSTALIHHVYHDSPSRRRVLSVLCDCILDTATTTAIPALLVLSYAKDYDFSLKGFGGAKWTDDVWFVNVLNEFQMIFVVSWANLAIRVVFSFGVISSMNGMKNLVRPCMKRTQVGTATTTTAAPGSRRPTAVATAKTAKATEVSPAIRIFDSNLDSRKFTLEYLRKLSPARLAFRARMTRTVDVLFFVWVLSSSAAPAHRVVSKPRTVQVAMNLDCYEFAIDGQRDDIEAQWSAFEALMVVRVVIKHCTNLEIPSTLQTFRNLNGIKIYNSTLVSWGVDAELTNTHAPKIMSVLLVRVDMTDGVLPLGLQVSDIPATLNDFEFCMTNLAELPDDLDLKWPRFATVYLEFSQLAYVPDVIVRLAPNYLSFAGSPIEEVPAALFETSGIAYIDIGWTKVSLLPSGVKSMSPSRSKLFALKTPYREYLERVLSGQVVASTPSPSGNALNVNVAAQPGAIGGDIPEMSPVLSNYSEAKWVFLEHKVVCTPRWVTIYDLSAEDAYSGIQGVSD